MEKKENQTAVQQVFSELQELHPGLFNIYSEDGRNFINHFHKFLAIEKQQIIDAHGIKSKTGFHQGIDFYEITTGEEYYNKTYNK
jgi:hypothetical protein